MWLPVPFVLKFLIFLLLDQLFRTPYVHLIFYPSHKCCTISNETLTFSSQHTPAFVLNQYLCLSFSLVKIFHYKSHCTVQFSLPIQQHRSHPQFVTIVFLSLVNSFLHVFLPFLFHLCIRYLKLCHLF